MIDRIRAELRAGRKASHWMWFVFPQIVGLGRSETARFYAIRTYEEAAAYLAHPVLGSRLVECTRLVNAVEGSTAEQIFGQVDAMKFHSCMTLFAHVCSPAQGHGMNSGLQDAINLAWKLALVCHGYCNPVLLDSYEAERRPVAEMITASGDAVELAQMIADPVERRTRDQGLRAMFASPDLRHHEAVAEAELDIDYGTSPIVMGTRHDKLAPGQRLPDEIEVHLADGGSCMLHELANRAGHTALLIGGSWVTAEALARVDRLMRAQIRASDIIEEVFVIAAGSGDQGPYAWITPAAGEQLGIGEFTLLVIRPDGHVGLRSDGDPVDDLAAYQRLLVSPP